MRIPLPFILGLAAAALSLAPVACFAQAAPSNDSVNNPVVFSPTGGVQIGSNAGATKENVEPNIAGNAGGRSIWYAWPANFSGTVKVSTAGSDFDTLLEVFTQNSQTGAFQSVASNDDEGNGIATSALSFNAQPRSNYFIAVDGKNGATGKVTLALSTGNSPNPPVNYSPVNFAANQSATVPLVTGFYSSVNLSGTLFASQWIVRHVIGGGVFANQTVSAASPNPEALTGITYPLGSYYWQARYLNTGGAWSAFSTPFTFTVATYVPPVAPVPPPTPRISVSVGQALAVVKPLRAGSFRISRTSSAKPISVSYSLSGGAPGVDFAVLPGVIAMPAGISSVNVPVTPIRGRALSDCVPVTLTLGAVKGYIQSQSSATLSIRPRLCPDRLVAHSGSAYRIDVDGQGEPAERTIQFGTAESVPLFGDFNGDGTNELMTNAGNAYSIDTTGTGGPAFTFTYGKAGDVAFIGNYDGTGRDTLILRHGNAFLVTPGNGGAPEAQFIFGQAADELVLRSDGVRTGDWDGDGRDDIFLRRGNLFLVRLSSNGAVLTFHYGKAASHAFLADFNGDGKVEPVVNSGSVYAADINHNEQSPLVLNFGLATDSVFAADMHGDGKDELVVQRGNNFIIQAESNGGAPAFKIQFGNPGETVFPMRVAP